MSKRRVNPRRVPASQADILRLKREITQQILSSVWSILFTVLRDKEGYDLEGLRRIWSEVEDLSDSIAKGYCAVSDLNHILKIEGDIHFTN